MCVSDVIVIWDVIHFISYNSMLAWGEDKSSGLEC